MGSRPIRAVRVGPTLLSACLVVAGCGRSPDPSDGSCPTPASSAQDEPEVEPPTEDVPSFQPISPEDVAGVLWPDDASKRWEEAIEDRRRRMIALVTSMAEMTGELAPLDVALLERRAHRAGFTLGLWEVEGIRYLALTEEDEHRSGGGAYVFRLGPRTHPEREIVLQAPHAFYDLGSGRVAVRVFFAGRANVRALFVNSIHRHTQPGGAVVPGKASRADVTLNPDSLFDTATDAVARTLDDVSVVQIHGFDSSSVEGEPAAIVSTGTEVPSDASRAIATGLASLSDRSPALYPEQTRAFGATDNVQGARIRAIFGAEFVHVELSRELRTAVLEDDTGDAARRLWNALSMQSDS